MVICVVGSGLRVLAGIFRMDGVSLLHDLASLLTGERRITMRAY